MFYIERNGERVSRDLGGPRRLSDVLSREEYAAVLRGDLAVFSSMGGGVDLSSRVVDGEVLRLVDARVRFDPLPECRSTWRLSPATVGPLAFEEVTEIIEGRNSHAARGSSFQPSDPGYHALLHEELTEALLLRRVLREVPAPAWLIDLVEDGRADALQADRAKVAGGGYPHPESVSAVPWTSGKRWFHHAAPPQAFDAITFESARRLLEKMGPSYLVIEPIRTFTEEERQSLAVLADAYRWNGSSLPVAVSAVETVSSITGRRMP